MPVEQDGLRGHFNRKDCSSASPLMDRAGRYEFAYLLQSETRPGKLSRRAGPLAAEGIYKVFLYSMMKASISEYTYLIGFA